MATRGNKRSSSGSTEGQSNFSSTLGGFSNSFDALMKAQRKNADSLSAAQNEALKAVKTIADNHNTFIQQRIGEASQYFQSLTSGGLNMREKLEAQSQSAKESFADCLKHTQHLNHIWNTAQERITEILQGRFEECAEEVRTTFKTPK
jgi:hypothetical protein